jgi:stage II sporulation protein D
VSPRRLSWGRLRRRLGSRGARQALVVAALVGGGILLASIPVLRDPGPEARPLLREVLDREPWVRVRIDGLAPGASFRAGTAALILESAAGTLRVPPGTGFFVEGTGLRDTRGLGHELPIRLRAEDAGPVAWGSRLYPGFLELQAEETGVSVVNHVPLEAYLEGVLEAEMGRRFHDAALEAQAIASRSYAGHAILARTRAGYDLKDDQSSQVYRGASSTPARFRRAVRATRGLVLAHEGRILPGIFMSCCGGSTRPAGEAFGGPTPPPLAGVDCGHCDDAPVFRWQVREHARTFAQRSGLRAPPSAVSKLRHSATGRLIEATFVASGSEQALPVASIRRGLGAGARSTAFTALAVERGMVVAEGRGFGHGVGLCQFGADRMARHLGAQALDILAAYYPGAQVAPWFPASAP